MSKLLTLLLFVLVLNEELDGITVYNGEKLTKLMSDVSTLNVNVGDEFYIKFYYYASALYPKDYRVYNFVNYNEIPAALENFNKNGRAFKTEGSKVFTAYARGYNYYKFKALKPSYNEITLKFNYIDSSFLKVENTTKYIKVNILAKK